MKKIIKKILREFLYSDEYIVSFSHYLTQNEYVILESKNKYGRNKRTQKEIQDYADSLGLIKGSFVDKKTNINREGFIKMNIGVHFAERVFRSVDKTNNNFVDVDKFEGVDVVVANADKIIQLIMSKNLKPFAVIKLKSKYGNLTYELLCSITDVKSGVPPVYTLELFNQIKGTSDIQFNYRVDNVLNVINPHFKKNNPPN